MGDSVRAHKELTGGWAKAAQLPQPDLSGLAIKDGHLKRALLGQDFLVVDGAMGTQLQERGLADAGQIPELLNFSHPDDIAAIHKAYVDAGAEVITTNTFGANRLKLEGAASVEEVYRAAAECARAAGAPYIAGDVGPTGALLEPMGTMSFEEAYDLFAEQVRAVAAAGCDVVLIETMADLREAKAALLAAQENCDLPVFATMTFGEDGRTFLGTSPEVAAEVLSSMGAHAVGLNCSLGPAELLGAAQDMARRSRCPLMVQPNAGLPRVQDGVTVFDVSSEDFAAAMEGKRLGLCQKSLFAVPNHLTEQWASEFLRLYPSANILVATKKDFETRNRKKFCARIATGDYDAVIIGHSQFERIPVSKERQERLLQEQIWEIEDGISELKASRAERFTIKELERTKKNLEAKLQKLHDAARKDDVVTFEQLGVDRLYVDEAHSFKNLFLYTKMRNVAGLSTTDAQKSSDMLLKCRYIDELTHGKGVTFATGTPISNSMTELYTMMRYLQHDMLKRNSLTHFDCWASAFGETTTAIELAPEGTGYRARTRFAKFFNLPELMNLFREAADIKTSDQLNLPTPTPVYHNEVSQPTPLQKQMVQELSERAAKVHAGIVDASTDNMLKITSDGRKLGLDQRIINPDLPDDPSSKVNLCVDNIHRIWQDGQAEKLTQLVFCDLSTPKGKAAQSGRIAAKGTDSPELHALEAAIDAETEPEEPPFTIYDDIREKLVARGIPREQIAFIHEANTETRKKELFAKVRSGQVRVLMGSTFKMGAGMNVQDRLVALHDLDCPWRPGDLEQRSGRIIRQGNRNKEVHIYRYVTESTFDAYLWQTVENKQKFISQIMTSKSPVRSCEDVDETALSYAEIKALCAGDERIKEKMDLDVDVARLKLMKASHQSQQFRLEDNLLRHFPEQIRQNESFVEGFTADMQTLAGHPHPVDGFAGMEVKGDLLTDKDNAGAAILEAFKDAKGMEPVPIGSYRGFAMSLTVEDFGRDFILTLKGKMNHRVTLGKDARGNLTRIDNALNAMPDRLQNVRNTLDALTAQMETAKAELGKPFPQEDELRTKSARLAELNAELNIDDRTPMEQMAEDAPAVQSAKAERPSVLAKLKAPLSQPCAEDKIRHRGKEER